MNKRLIVSAALCIFLLSACSTSSDISESADASTIVSSSYENNTSENTSTEPESQNTGLFETSNTETSEIDIELLMEQCRDVALQFAKVKDDLVCESDPEEVKEGAYAVFCDGIYKYRVDASSMTLKELSLVSRDYDSIPDEYLYATDTFETLMREVLNVEYDVVVKDSCEGYVQYSEIQNGYETGAQSIFLFDEYLWDVTFTPGSVYDIDDSDFIGEDAAYECALKKIEEYWNGDVIVPEDQRKPTWTIRTFKGRVFYETNDIVGYVVGTEGDGYATLIWVDAFNGEILEFAEGYGYGAYQSMLRN